VAGAVKANSGDLLCALAVAGQGIIFQPAFVVGAEIASGKLLPVLEGFEPQPRSAYAIYPSNRFIPAKVRALTDIIAIELSDDGRGRVSQVASQNQIAAAYSQGCAEGAFATRGASAT
jgi:DNA-binding transcriptional LysR family regulator